VNARVEISDDLLELEVRELWGRLLRRDDVGLDEDFFEAGGDSVTAVQMLVQLEELAGRPYPETELSELTVRRIAHVLRNRMPAERRCVTQVKAGSGIAPFQADLESADVWTRLRAVRRMAKVLHDDGSVPAPAAGIPFFFCHGDFQARGLYAHQLAALLPAAHPVYLLHPESEPPAGTTVEDLAQRYLREVRRLAPGMPVILGGYCNGGYVAWHLAHLLRAKGAEVLGVFLVETPSQNARPVLRTVASLLRRAPRLQESGTRAVRSLYRHGGTRFLRHAYDALAARLRSIGEPRAVASWWAFVRGMSARYVPPPIDVDVYCFLAQEEDRLDADPARWRRLTPRVHDITVPGTHRSAVIQHRQALAAAFAGAMRAVSARRAVPARCQCPRAPVEPAR
jgi:thioesterase domain-containing protein